jgi:2-keto-4-pentenoate hydratase
MANLSAAQLLAYHDGNRYWPEGCGFTLAQAYEHALAVRDLRIARGEQPLGFKVGFTNRGIWPRYNVYAPIWGTVWNTTLSFCDGRGTVSLAGCCEPRIEPEAVFGIAATPPVDASLEDLLACLEWVAPGFEIVQSHLRGWKFEASDTVADGGLHARLLVGPRVRVQGDAAAFEQRLAQARVALYCAGRLVDRGRGANVLDGPLHALGYFVAALRGCPSAPELRPGDIVTTGTWTDAWPVAPGEHWRAVFDAPFSTLGADFC